MKKHSLRQACAIEVELAIKLAWVCLGAAGKERTLENLLEEAAAFQRGGAVSMPMAIWERNSEGKKQ